MPLQILSKNPYAFRGTFGRFRIYDTCRLMAMINTFENTILTKLVPSKRIGFDHDYLFGSNITEDIKQLRFSLTTDEIERYRIGGRLVNLAVEETAATIRPGDTELQVVAQLHEIVRKYDIDIVSAMCSSDERIRFISACNPKHCNL